MTDRNRINASDIPQKLCSSLRLHYGSAGVLCAFLFRNGTFTTIDSPGAGTNAAQGTRLAPSAYFLLTAR